MMKEMSYEELLNELIECRDLGDSPIGEHWGVFVKKSVIAGAVEAVKRLMELEPLTNDPLNLEELREMDGDIVYITPINDWARVVKYGLLYFGTADYSSWNEGIGKTYGETWLAYRHKPEEGKT